MSRLPVGAVAPLLVLLLASPLQGAKIEAVRGKRYRLSQRNGPWMIMVASFQDVPDTIKKVDDNDRVRYVPNENKRRGDTALEAADQLVYELRRYGIPAYVYEQENQYEQVRTKDFRHRDRMRTIEAQKRNVAVLAGNYRSARNDTAQTTLGILKRFRPKFLAGNDGSSFTTHSASGGVYHPTPGQPGPLSGAFLTMNPMLTPEQALRMSGENNKLLRRLNSGNEFSLAGERGYTIRVATLTGKQTTYQFGSKPRESFFDSDGSSLDKAARNAWMMTKYMRSKGTKAFLHHQQFGSLVTIGAFESPDDPRIPEVIRYFSPKVVQDPRTGEKRMRIEYLTIPPTRKGGQEYHLPFDPEPALIPIPAF